MKYQEIILKFRKDLNEGLTALFENYGNSLYNYSSYHWHLDEDESYDVLYKTLETIGKVIHRYEFTSEKHFKNWIFKIHKNYILMLFRNKMKNDVNITTYSYDDWVTEANSLQYENFRIDEFKNEIDKLININPFEKSTLKNRLMLALNKALQQISEIERELLLLRMNNYSYEEIAEMLSIENNQLKVKFHRAKAKVEKKTLEILKEVNNEKN